MQHSDSYSISVDKGGPAGENLYWASWKANPTEVVEAWYSEINECNALPGCTYSTKGGMVGHFTAVVWKGASRLACTRSDVEPGLLACRYGGDTNG